MNYLPYIFRNGRVVMVPQKDIDDAIEQNKEILIFCGAWSGGYAKAIGGEKTTYDGKPCIQMYSYDVQDTEFSAEQMSKFHKVIVSSGIRVYMKTGHPASMYSDRFVDQHTTYEDFKQSLNYAGETYEEFCKMRSMVDQRKTLSMRSAQENNAYYAALNSMASFHRT